MFSEKKSIALIMSDYNWDVGYRPMTKGRSWPSHLSQQCRARLSIASLILSMVSMLHYQLLPGHVETPATKSTQICDLLAPHISSIHNIVNLFHIP